jgi:hypothetical protein
VRDVLGGQWFGRAGVDLSDALNAPVESAVLEATS